MDDSEDYIALVDYSSGSNSVFFGEAVPGSSTGEQVWRIRLFFNNQATGIASVLWADGNNNFDKIWDNRRMYVYE